MIGLTDLPRPWRPEIVHALDWDAKTQGTLCGYS